MRSRFSNFLLGAFFVLHSAPGKIGPPAFGVRA